MRAVRFTVIALVLTALFNSAPPVRAEGEAFELERATRRALERSAKDLAGLGDVDGVERIFDLLRVAEIPTEELGTLRAKCAKAAKRAKPNGRRAASVGKRLAKATDALVTGLAGLSGDRRVAYARALLAIDDSLEPARVALGHVEIDGVWMSPNLAHTRDGKRRVAEIVGRATRTEFKLVAGPSDNPLIERLCGRPARKVTWKNVSLHGPFPEGRLRRILLTVLRARAASEELLFGRKLEKPLSPGRNFYLVDSRKAYLAAIDAALEKGSISAAWAERFREMDSFIAGKDLTIRFDIEMYCGIQMYVWLSDWADDASRGVQPTLRTGHTNWICLTMFGVPMPGIGLLDVTGGSGGPTMTEADRWEREEMFRISDAGIAGCRAFMRWLVERGEDPTWASTFVDQWGRVEPLGIFKTTMVTAYLQEIGVMRELLDSTKRRGNRTRVSEAHEAIFEVALDMPLAEFEGHWREWLTGARPGLIQRLGADGAGEPKASPEARRAAAMLAVIRKTAFGDRLPDDLHPLRVERELSAGCRAHAEYLKLHPKQLEAWPDAHEEYPDQEGFSALGSGSGLRSVIAPGVATEQEAIDAWMATFYHRLPLTSPGLLGIGWALENGVAVLDCASLTTPWESVGRYVMWPADGARDVPRSFRPELPSPVPGEDQSKWGYPVTLQGGLYDVRMTMTLHEGGADGARVDCHFSTPWKPTNDRLAPDAAACLIPKRTLKAMSAYTVVVEKLPGGARLMWSFKTGK